ncbi:protein kinase [Actinoallomurus sp. NPDC050550]|uniref:serine/threonine-protein kinase n=1 Tax=Actinoallomurus sp. NPDC050550 TaxID=3154937 RepID=UPI0033F97BB4
MPLDDRVGSLRAGDPTKLGPYRLLGVIGRGGMGTVYLAESASAERVAVKVINADFADEPSFRDRFRREVAAARRVRRFCTAPVLDAQVDGEPLYIVTEYVAGPDLAKFVRESGPMSGSSLDHLAVGVATALGAIHGAGIVHRDLKPANVLLSPMGPRVIDFGIARALDSLTEATGTGEIIGTPAYMAPEVIQGERATTASDVFAWGAVVAFAGTGAAPFPGAILPAVLYRITHGTPLLDGLDDAVRPLVEQALNKDPARRPTAQELLTGLVVPARTPTAPPRTGSSARDTPGDPGDSETVASARATLPSPGDPGSSEIAASADATRPSPSDPGSPATAGSARTPRAPATTPGADDVAGTGPAAPEAAVRGWSRSRRLAWVGAAGAAVAVTVGSVITLWPSDGRTQGGETNLTAVYTSEFASNARTWGVDKGTSYVGGRYRMKAEGRTGNDSKPAPYPSQNLPARMEADVDAKVVSGPGDGMMGLWCRGPDDQILDGYVFLVRRDGHGAFIRKVTAGGSQTLAQVPLATGYDVKDGLDERPPGANRFGIQCESDGAKVRLRLSLNGRLTAEATDAHDPLALGQTGLVVMRGSGAHGGRMIVDFDNYEIFRISGPR